MSPGLTISIIAIIIVGAIAWNVFEKQWPSERQKDRDGDRQ
jgi:hypothetical protein